MVEPTTVQEASTVAVLISEPVAVEDAKTGALETSRIAAVATLITRFLLDVNMAISPGLPFLYPRPITRISNSVGTGELYISDAFAKIRRFLNVMLFA